MISGSIVEDKDKCYGDPFTFLNQSGYKPLDNWYKNALDRVVEYFMTNYEAKNTGSLNII